MSLVTTLIAAGGIVLGSGMVEARTHEAEAVHSQFLEKLNQLAGANAMECGAIDSRDDSALALNCAREANSRGQAFWLAMRLQGVDSEIWTGAVRDRTGRLYRIDFDSDARGGSESKPKPTLVVWKCGLHDVDGILSAWPLPCNAPRPKRGGT
jgi:hypothetical protein